MHLLLDLGQLCAKNAKNQDSPAYSVTPQPSGVTEARVSCVAVHQGKKIDVVLRMEPLVLRTFEAVHGKVRAGDPLDVNICKPAQVQTYRREFAADGFYFLLTTDTLSRAPLAHQASTQAANEPNTPKEQTA